MSTIQKEFCQGIFSCCAPSLYITSSWRLLTCTKIENNIKTGKNESFNAIPVNAKAAADITYTDAEDNTEKTTSRQAVQFSWDKSAVAGFEQAE